MNTGFVNDSPVKSDWLLYEEDGIGRYSRENLTLAANVAVKEGEVLIWTTSGKTAVTPADSGTATHGVAGISINNVEASATSQPIAVLNKHARIVYDKLFFASTIDTGEKATLKTALTTSLPTIAFVSSV